MPYDDEESERKSMEAAEARAKAKRKKNRQDNLGRVAAAQESLGGVAQTLQDTAPTGSESPDIDWMEYEE